MSYHHGNLRQKLLERAAHVIAEQGIESLSLRALARDLGVSHAAPTRHFADKAALLRALATEGSDRFIDYIMTAADEAKDDPLERYAAMGKAYIRFSLTYPAYYRAINHPEVAAHADRKLNESAERRHDMIFEAARAAQAAGWLSDERTEDVMMFSIATVRGAAASLSDPLHGPGEMNLEDEDSTTDDLIERIVRLIIDPAAPQKSRSRNAKKNASTKEKNR